MGAEVAVTYDLSARLAAALRRGAIIIPRDGEIPKDHTAAEAICDSAAAQSAPAVAWKLGATIASVRERLGVDRQFFGGVPEGHLFAGGAVLDHPGTRLRGVESEYGFALARDLSPGDAELAAGPFQALFSTVHACIEVPGSRFATLGEYGGYGMVADFGAVGALVAGPGQALGAPSRLDDVEVVLEIGGETAVKGGAGVIDGGAFGPLRAFIRDALRRGYRPRAGQIIVTGSCTGYVEVPLGVPVTAHFPALGTSVSCSFAEPPS